MLNFRIGKTLKTTNNGTEYILNMLRLGIEHQTKKAASVRTECYRQFKSLVSGFNQGKAHRKLKLRRTHSKAKNVLIIFQSARGSERERERAKKIRIKVLFCVGKTSDGVNVQTRVRVNQFLLL